MMKIFVITLFVHQAVVLINSEEKFTTCHECVRASASSTWCRSGECVGDTHLCPGGYDGVFANGPQGENKCYKTCVDCINGSHGERILHWCERAVADESNCIWKKEASNRCPSPHEVIESADRCPDFSTMAPAASATTPAAPSTNTAAKRAGGKESKTSLTTARPTKSSAITTRNPKANATALQRYSMLLFFVMNLFS